TSRLAEHTWKRRHELDHYVLRGNLGHWTKRARQSGRPWPQTTPAERKSAQLLGLKLRTMPSKAQDKIAAHSRKNNQPISALFLRRCQGISSNWGRANRCLHWRPKSGHC